MDAMEFGGGGRKPLYIGIGIGALAIVIIIAVVLGVVLSPKFTPYQLPATSTGQLMRLQRTDVRRDNGDNPVVARSYDGNPWETVSDQDFEPVTIECAGTSCKVTTKGTYQVQEIAVPDELKAATDTEKFARFLSQATFGFRKSDLQSVPTNYLQWIQNQMSLPPTLLRTYYRQRTNPRQEASTDVGSLYLPCEVGSRYHQYAFNTEDKGSVVTIAISGGVFTFTIGGILRAEVSVFQNGTTANTTLTFPLNLTLCDVGETLGSTMRFAPVTNTSACTILMQNPAIQFSAPGANVQTLQPSEATFVSLPSRSDVLILSTISVTCNLGTRDSYISVNSQFYKYDPRLKLLENTLENPVDTNAVASLKCPAVVKTFLNNASCVRRAGCAPLTFSPVLVNLNDTIIRSWYTDSARYVYYVTGLRLEAPFFTSPCSGSSRWQRLGASPCPAPTAGLDPMSVGTISAALANSTDANPYVRDISLNGRNCTSNNTALIGAQIDVNGECFMHVHPDLYSVRDFTYWTLFHDGNVDALLYNHPNPIAKWADQGGTNLPFPSNHPMQRFYEKKYAIPAIGRYGDNVEFRTFPTELQTVLMAQRVGAIATRSSDGFEVCGSPGETANIPALGHRYQMPDLSPTDIRNRELDYKHPFASGKSMLWTNVIMTADDQLRQRVAWALAQIFTMANAGIEGRDSDNEPWANYYDIFIRNAFGNYRDMMREVSFNPFMSLYLSYYQNKAFAFASTYPDENYAREIMQLFSIGLWKLDEDGSHQLDSNGFQMPTYTNDDIVDFARLWTGFDSQQPRSNIEQQGGAGSTNVMDPLQIKPGWRDLLPKAKLDNGYLGDNYPLCDNLPPQHWTKAGARFVFTGGKSIEGNTVDTELPTDVGFRGRLTPSTTSTLYQLLCKPEGNGKCTFPSEVTLSQNIPCDGKECTAARVIAVKIVDPVANVTKYFSYYSVPCVRLTFFGNGKLSISGGSKQCTNPNHTVGAPACCANATPTRVVTNLTSICNFANEAMDFQTASDRCRAAGLGLCNINYTGTSSWFTSCATGVYQWVNASCSLKAQVYLSGQIGIFDPLAPTSMKVLARSSGNVFRVRWADGNFPAAKNGCGAGCTVLTTATGDTCICDIQVTDRKVFSESRVPSVSEITSVLYVGAAVPSSFGNGVYVPCTSAACNARSDVTVWTKSGSTEWGMDTIFEIPPSRAGGPKRYLLNIESVVHIDSFSFRNPPHFMPLAGEQTSTSQQWTSDILWLQRATQEVEDLLDHLFEHPSTAPFVAYRMIQRMVTSNPSQRYMKSVVKAFRTGAYNGQVFSGKYGDMAATVAAVLLDKEARSTTLEADPSFGVLREPLLKVIHVLRAMEYTSRGAEIMLPNIAGRIGMESFNSPTVFGFYLPENRPDGPVTEAGLVSPEAQLGVSPIVIGYLNGMSSLVDNGLSPCSLGFGFSDGRSCSGANANATADGWFKYTPTSSVPSDVIDELDLLLTNSRLNPANRDYILKRYSAAVGNTTASAALALKLAQKLVISTPEFHATQANILKNKTRPKSSSTKSLGRPYKAIVVIFMAGGCDSYSMLVPHSNCSAKDLYQEYSDVRGIATIDKANLLPINVPAGTQPCNTFGVHDTMPNLKNLYDAGDALFLSSIGALVEPITKADYFKTSGKIKRYPPSLFAHNIMTRSMHNLDPQNTGSKGVLGRAVSALSEQAAPYKSDLYSLIGTVKMLEGNQGIDFIDPYSGVTKYLQYSQFAQAFGNFTEYESEAHFSETYSRLLKTSIEKTEALAGQLANTTLNATFGNDYVSAQLRQVAKLIKMRDYLQTERAVFVTQRGGYDTHNSVNMQNLFGDIDRGLGSFVAEMKAQGMWDDVAVLTVSEFGRTLTTNGAGTDHAWAGNHFLAGGKLRGGKILGKYPDTLTDNGISSIGRGRLLPTTSWEAVWKGLVQWFGVQDGQLPYVLPNLGNFPTNQVYSASDLFQ